MANYVDEGMKEYHDILPYRPLQFPPPTITKNYTSSTTHAYSFSPYPSYSTHHIPPVVGMCIEISESADSANSRRSGDVMLLGDIVFDEKSHESPQKSF